MVNRLENCSGCGREIKKNIHNKCLYCGTAYPTSFHFTEEERQEKLSLIEKKAEYDKQRTKGKSNTGGGLEGYLGAVSSSSDCGDSGC